MRVLPLTRPEQALASMSSILHLEGKQRKEYHFQIFKKILLKRFRNNLCPLLKKLFSNTIKCSSPEVSLLVMEAFQSLIGHEGNLHHSTHTF